MAKPYYILSNGELSSSLILGRSYIIISCGSDFKFNPGRVKEILSKEVCYSLNFLEESVAEIHYSCPPFSIEGVHSVKNTPSEVSFKEFVQLIK